MPRGKSQRTEDVRFTSDELVEAKLLATFPKDRAWWDVDAIFRISNFRSFSVFFCPSLHLLARRGKTIERVCRDHLPEYVARRYISSLARGEPVTLNKILEIDRLLDAIANSPEPRVRESTLVSRDGKLAPLQLQEDSVIPSHLWVERTLLHTFRQHFLLRKRDLGYLVFGDAAFAENIIELLEAGASVRSKSKERLLYDYRVSPFTADAIYSGLKLIFDQFPELHHGTFPVLPSQSQFFIGSHTAGEGSGRRTLALPIANGNLMSAMTAKAREQMARRVKEYAKKNAR